MKWFFVLPLIIPAALSNQAERRAALTELETQWQVEDPDLSYNSDTGIFTFNTAHGPGDGTTLPIIEIYGYSTGPTESPPNRACPTVSPSYATLIGAPGDDIFLTLVGEVTEHTEEDPDETTWQFRVDSSVVGDSRVFLAENEGPNTALVSFCVRIGLQDVLTGQLVSFKELGIDIDFNLAADLTVTDFNTQAYDPGNDYSNPTFTVDAVVCPGPIPPNWFSQNEEIPICVCTDQIPTVTVARVYTLHLEGQGSYVGLSQSVVNEGGAVGNAVDIVEPCFETTDPVSGVVLSHCCRVNVIPNAYFFPVIADEYVNVKVTGTAILAIDGARRNLRAEVRMLEEVKADFETEIPLGAKKEEMDSGALTIASTAGLFLGAAGALLI